MVIPIQRVNNEKPIIPAPHPDNTISATSDDIYTLTTEPTMALHHPLATNRNYLTLDFAYSRTLNTATSNVLIHQFPGTIPVTLRNTNNRGINSFGLGFGFGHEWQLTPSWSWSLGGQITRRELSPTGNSSLLISRCKCGIPYQYNIASTLVSVLVRLIYNQNLWQYYMELNTGIDLLTSDNYKTLSKKQTDNYADNSITQWAKGIALGMIYHLTPRTSLGLSVGYIDLGKAELGTRDTPAPVTSLVGLTRNQILLEVA